MFHTEFEESYRDPWEGELAMSLARRNHKRHLQRVAGARPAFTLLEVILALALSVLVMGAITTAVYLHLDVLDRRRTRIENARLARSVLQMMANDIRSAVQYKPVDMSDLEAMMSGIDVTALLASEAGMSALNDFTGGDPAGALAGGSLAGDMLGGSDEIMEDESESGFTGNIADSSLAPDEPGVYGTSSELLIDTSRLPRKDQYNPLLASAVNVTDIPSDIKTISYYLAADEGDAPTTGIASLDTGFGLTRREVSRAVSRYAQDGGAGLDGLGNAQLVAAEVGALEFSYFDGTDWVEEWDSASTGTLPLAIQITIALVDDDDENGGALVDISDADPDNVFSLVVHLPIAEPPEEEEDAESIDGEQGEAGAGADAAGAGAEAGASGR